MSQHTELIARLRALAKSIADAGINGFGNECSDIADALQAMERVPMTEWQPIDTAPKDGRTLLLGYFNSHKKWRTMRGQWFSQDVINEEWEEPDMAGEGWYETCVENDDMPNCWWTAPTHWHPLPTPPESKG